jgi:hydrogenase maturation protease
VSAESEAEFVMKTIVIGLGNPILGDDGVGWRVVEEIQKELPSPPTPLPQGDGSHVDFGYLSVGGIGLMEQLIGYDRAILIDAFVSEAEDVGSILIRKLNDLPNYSAFHITSAHDTSLQNAIEMGKTMGAHLPEDVTVIGVAIRQISDFGEELSPPVAAAVPEAAHIASKLLKQIAFV